MSIRIQHLNIQHDTTAWVFDRLAEFDATNDETYAVDMLALVRHIMRERGDCTIIPVVNAFVVHPTNEYGHNAQIEVTYDHKGHRAIYAANLNGKVTNCYCYCD